MTQIRPRRFERLGATIEHGDFLEVSRTWPDPTVIVSDGAYGIGSFPGDPTSSEDLTEWYAPHILEWSKRAMPETTLWFWNTELGWATIHPLLLANGWSYRACHIWDKGLGHIAGNANSRTLRRFPVVTEVCVQYVRRVRISAAGRTLDLKQWLRHEWQRSGLPLSRSNEACGVRNAATRKYLTQCEMWYFPPAAAMQRLVDYANIHGEAGGRPYFSLDGVEPVDAATWGRMRAKFRCDVGITNVWRTPAVRGRERLKRAYKAIHSNQKPLELLERIITASSDEGDVVWDPFGGLCSVAIASANTSRRSFSAEVESNYFEAALVRLDEHAISAPLALRS